MTIIKPALPTAIVKRVMIKEVNPSVMKGLYPAKGAVGFPLKFSAKIFADGHDRIFARIWVKEPGTTSWREVALSLIENDTWEAEYIPKTTGLLVFKIQAWLSELASWRDAFEKKREAGALTSIDLQEGVRVIENLVSYTVKADQKALRELAAQSKTKGLRPEDIDEVLYQKALRISPGKYATTSGIFEVDVERKKAQCSTWYELFPRSCASEAGRHGNFHDVIALLPTLAAGGFDVLYLPPIHPIGKHKRKGKNNSLDAQPSDPGSPWAVGSEEGGHKSIHPELGTMNEFKLMVREAHKLGIEIALDIAFQCAPDHPYVKVHPEWFKWRPDGTVQFAENPPKKYEDILPFNFETEDWRALWEELFSVFVFWIKKGIKIFRVDNPHTKPLGLWQWLIAEVRKTYPDTIFLAEAFTRPAIMEHLAMVGFTQSYTYFTWRTGKAELQRYLTELTKGPAQFFFRPNFWPNTPDILPDHLVNGGLPMHVIRLLLAGTLSSSYGIYGPVYQLAINTPMTGKEEYADNEKYEIRSWPSFSDTLIWKMITRLNKIRREFKVLQMTNNIEFMDTSNDQIIAYMKTGDDRDQSLMVIINLDPHHTQSGWVHVPLSLCNNVAGSRLSLADQLNNENYVWRPDWNYVELNPWDKPAHIFSVILE